MGMHNMTTKPIFLLPLLLIISTYTISASNTSLNIQLFDKTTLNGSLHDLLDTSLGETLAQAQNAHQLISNMNLSSFNDDRAKTAWNDCRYLYQDAIDQLNRSIASINNRLDVQTWLSAVMANQETCQNGFLDFGLPPLSSQSFYLHLTNANMSKFLSNALAINKAISSTSSSAKENRNPRLLANDFPQWVSTGDRILLQSSGNPGKAADIVVAQDGSGSYKNISEGLVKAATMSGTKRIVMYVKRGIYKENVVVDKYLKNLMLIGDGIDATIVTGSNNVQNGYSTFGSATFSGHGNGLIVRGMTFENTAGAEKHQAVAVLSTGDNSVFYQCSFKGYQDTLYVHSNRQFYRDCDIYGTVDFIFGDAVAVIQNCNIYLRQPMPKQKNTITAQGRTNPDANSGIVVHRSRVTAAPGEAPVENYLGRPWQLYSRTVFIMCIIDDLIAPAGWLEWEGDFALTTLYYGEYMNTGGGADTSGRVKWPGFHIIASAGEAAEFSVQNFLAGDRKV
ncbi:pectinesterase-like [Salvia miltiorrhiza]|uniref:pectinesterase-like n=1 Tax=Salvia miltiorrhiza TaxID=226208 RepID=UPI0025ABF08D|nr:pectinesterase-like [Salvia miltiorrhiza]